MRIIETRHNGYRFRSRIEARWAVFFDTLGLQYEYEKEGYALPSGPYFPDFYLPEIRYWVEVKGEDPTRNEVISCIDLWRATQRPVLIAAGSPRDGDQLLHVPPKWGDPEACDADNALPNTELAGKIMRGSRCRFAEDRRNEREFWLISDGAWGFSIGPKSGPDHGKYPITSPLMISAYEAARSARFDGR